MLGRVNHARNNRYFYSRFDLPHLGGVMVLLRKLVEKLGVWQG